MSLQRLTGLKVGIFTGIIMVLYSLFIQWTQDQTHQIVNSLGYFIQGIGIAYAYSEFKKTGDGFMSYKQGLSVGFWLSLMAGFVLGIQCYIETKFLDSPKIREILDLQHKYLVENHYSQKEVTQFMNMYEVWLTPETIIFDPILKTLISGFFLSMMLTSFMQKYPSSEDNN